jgi:opacity protein-like surface antigen
MRKYLLAAVAAAAIASPAQAQVAPVTGPYVGIEGGVLFPKDTNIDADVNFADEALDDLVFDNIIEVDYKRGRDIDVIAGYDLGGFRLEAELAFKRASLNDLELADEYQDEFGEDEAALDDFDLAGRAKVRSIMANGLVDFDAGGFRAYVGGGIGRARVKLLGDRDNAFAFQAIAGVGFPISPNIELGAKYRFFRTGNLEFQENFAVTDADVLFRNESRFRSHSLLASLIFNLGAPAVVEAPYVAPVAAPPPPVAPATQTCPDGSVVMATDICPAPPPPPPPPPMSPGERG